MTNNRNNTRYYRNLLEREKKMHPGAFPVICSGDDGQQLQTDQLVLGTVLHSYVIWLLREAMDKGIQRLYFLARDGYLPYLTAKEFCKKLEIPVECRYYYCSRASLRIPMYHRDIPQALEHICRGGLNVTPRTLMVRGGIRADQAGALLEKLELGFEPDEKIPYAALPQVREKLARSQPFLETMTRNSQERMPALERYFVQEGLLEDVPFGLVDCGWTGSMQKAIWDIRYVLGAKDRPKGFYFGLYYLPKNCEPEDYQSFFFGPGRKLLRKAFFNNNLFEVVFSAPHGTTEGYLLRDGHSEPILAEPDGQIAAYIHLLETTLCRSTASLLDTLTRAEFEKLDMEYLGRVTSALLWRLMWAPDRLEAETYGMLPFSDELQDANRQVLAPDLDRVSLRQHHVLYRVLMMLGFRRGRDMESAWYEASAVRSSKHDLRHRLSHLVYKLLLYLRPR